MNIIVTGASGFIGSNLVKFIRKNIEANVLSVARTNKENVNHIVKNYEQVIDLNKNNNILIHLAGQNVSNNELNKEEYITLKSLSQIYRNRMVYISSALVYGDNIKGKVDEDYPLNGYSNYAINKINSEKEVLRNCGTVLRLANVYGEGMSKKSVFYDIYKQFLDNKSQIKVNNSLAVRDFIHIDDVCRAIKRVSHNPKNGVFNVCTGIGTSIHEIFRFIQNIYGDYEKELISIVQRDSNLILDPKNTKCSFDWSYSISIEDGLNNLFINKEFK